MNEYRKELLGFRIQRHDSHGYQNVTVSLITDHFAMPHASVSWQANNDLKWYGGSLDLSGSSAEYLHQALRFIVGLKDLHHPGTKELRRFESITPAEYVTALERSGLEEVRPHPNAHRWYSAKNWPTKGAYKMIIPSASYPFVSWLFADSEEDAKKEAIKYIAEHDRYFDWMQEQVVEYHSPAVSWEPRAELEPAPEVIAS